jgi:hypothetical protein
VGQSDKNPRAPSGAAEKLCAKFFHPCGIPSVRLHFTIFNRRFAAENKKRRPLLDALAILFEEFHALSPT